MERAVRFYRDGLGLPTSAKEDDPIAFFKTSGACLALYPIDKLAEDVSPGLTPDRSAFSGVTLAHNTRTQAEVDQLLKTAEAAGGKIEKHAQDTFWGGYSGYFSDPDGHLWEVAFSKDWKFHDDGSLVIA
jgi:catechol 2,3-dioxygenase-like lactoylglutathione lyase family enzyme